MAPPLMPSTNRRQTSSENTRIGPLGSFESRTATESASTTVATSTQAPWLHLAARQCNAAPSSLSIGFSRAEEMERIRISLTRSHGSTASRYRPGRRLWQSRGRREVIFTHLSKIRDQTVQILDLRLLGVVGGSLFV